MWLFLLNIACTKYIVDGIVESYIDYSKWDDGNIHIVFGGTGTLSSDTRAGSSVAVVISSNVFIFDTGPGSTRNLLQHDVPLQRSKNIFISHLHSDHYGDLGEFSIASEIFGRQQGLIIHGPTGTTQMVDGFAQAYQQDHSFRKAQHPDFMQTETSLFQTIELHDPKDSDMEGLLLSKEQGTEILALDNVHISALLVQHEPVAPAISYRIDYKGRSVVISGDTAFAPTLADFAQGADILIHEAMDKEFGIQLSESFEEHGDHRKAEMILESMSNHSTPDEAGKIAKMAGVEHLVLTHISPPLKLPHSTWVFQNKSKKHYSGQVSIAQDGLHLTLDVTDSQK